MVETVHQICRLSIRLTILFVKKCLMKGFSAQSNVAVLQETEGNLDHTEDHSLWITSDSAGGLKTDDTSALMASIRKSCLHSSSCESPMQPASEHDQKIAYLR